MSIKVAKALLKPSNKGLERFFSDYYDDMRDNLIDPFDLKDDNHFGKTYYKNMPYEFRLFLGFYRNSFEYMKYYFNKYYNLPNDEEPYFSCKKFLKKNPQCGCKSVACRHSTFSDNVSAVEWYFYRLIWLVNNYENIVKEREKWENDYLHRKPKESGEHADDSFSAIGRLSLRSHSGGTLKLYDETIKLLKDVMKFMTDNQEKLSHILDDNAYIGRPCSFTRRFNKIDGYVLI